MDVAPLPTLQRGVSVLLLCPYTAGRDPVSWARELKSKLDVMSSPSELILSFYGAPNLLYLPINCNTLLINLILCHDVKRVNVAAPHTGYPKYVDRMRRDVQLVPAL